MIMKNTTFQRIVKSGVINFFRNGSVSVATVLVMSLSLLMLISVLLGGIFFDAFIQGLQDKVDVSVYFKRGADEKDILSLKQDISARQEVKDVVYVSQEIALQRFMERHKGEELILRSLEVVEGNPFSASLEISAADPSKYDAISSFLEQERYKPLIDIDSQGRQKITYRQNQDVIDRLNSMLRVTRAIGLSIGIVLAVIATIMAYNTVRLAIYSARDEISVMQLVGASHGFVRGPFLVEGVIHGIISATFTIIVLYPAIWWIGDKTATIFGGLNIFSYFISNLFQIMLLVLALGIGLGVLSSQLAIRKYLKV